MAEHFEVEEIMERRKRFGKTEFMVKWCDSWVTETQLLADSDNNAKLLDEYKRLNNMIGNTSSQSPNKSTINHTVNDVKQRNARKSATNVRKKTVSKPTKKRYGVIKVVHKKSPRIATTATAPRASRSTPSKKK